MDGFPMLASVIFKLLSSVFRYLGNQFPDKDEDGTLELLLSSFKDKKAPKYFRLDDFSFFTLEFKFSTADVWDVEICSDSISYTTGYGHGLKAYSQIKKEISNTRLKRLKATYPEWREMFTTIYEAAYAKSLEDIHNVYSLQIKTGTDTVVINGSRYFIFNGGIQKTDDGDKFYDYIELEGWLSEEIKKLYEAYKLELILDSDSKQIKAKLNDILQNYLKENLEEELKEFTK